VSGQSFLTAPDRNINEPIRVVVTGATSAAMQANWAAVEQMLYMAQLRQLAGFGDRVYLTWQPDGYAASWRSEVLGGAFEPQTGATVGIEWGTFRVLGVLSLSRRPYFEGPLTDVGLGIGGEVSATGGIPTHNHCDATRVDDEPFAISGGDNYCYRSGTLEHTPVLPYSVSVTYTIGSTSYTATDDGAGVLTGTYATGTIDYATGAWTLTLTNAQTAVTGEVMGTGDGVETHFSGTLAHYPVEPYSLDVAHIVGGVPSVAEDNGAGLITGGLVNTGTLDYGPADWDITFDGPVDDDTYISGSYHYYSGGSSSPVDFAYTYGGHVNFVDIPSAEIEGALFAPAKLSLLVGENGVSPYDSLREVFVAHNWRSSPLTFDHVQEGEANFSGLGAEHADASCSNGLYETLTWTGTTETFVGLWLLPGAQALAAAGGMFRVLARTPSQAYSNLWLRLRLYPYHGSAFSSSTSKPCWTGPLTLATTSEFQDLGVFQLPPAGVGVALGECPDYFLALWATRNQSGTHALDIDFMHLLPLDSWRHVYRVGDQEASAGETLVDDGVEGELYALVGGDGTPGFVGSGLPIMLAPGVAQRLYFLTYWDTTAPVDHVVTVSVKYRPRKLSL
jgi:hypothetical protein